MNNQYHKIFTTIAGNNTDTLINMDIYHEECINDPKVHSHS